MTCSRPSIDRTNNHNNNTDWQNYHRTTFLLFIELSLYAHRSMLIESHRCKLSIPYGWTMNIKKRQKCIWNEYANMWMWCIFVQPPLPSTSTIKKKTIVTNLTRKTVRGKKKKQKHIVCRHRCGHNLGSTIFCSLQITVWPATSARICVRRLLLFV